MSKVHCADQPVLPAHKLQSPAESGLVRPTPVHCRPTVHGTLYTVPGVNNALYTSQYQESIVSSFIGVLSRKGLKNVEICQGPDRS